jgi:hypothetical protein
MKNKLDHILKVLLILFLTILISSCSEDDSGIAPYVGSPGMSDVVVQDSSYKPKITWKGGYVSVLGVNYGTRAALDSTLVFLIYKPGNDIHYPAVFGDVPAGAQDLTTQYGGTRADTLTEDSTYTFWVLKEEEWNQISSMSNKILQYDSTLTIPLEVAGDTIKLSNHGHTQLVSELDVYIDITSVTTAGRLGVISIQETNITNSPVISWTITQANVTDTLQIAAMGIVEGGQFNPDAEIWSVYSLSDSAGQPQYGKVNIIDKPVVAGQSIPGTQVFVEYPEGGLKKNTSYYVWIANRFWDGEGRLRVTNYYAYATFNTD